MAMKRLMDAGSAIDVETLTDYLGNRHEIEAVGGRAYLFSLTEGLPRRPAIDDYIRILRDKGLLRRTMKFCAEAIANAADQSEPALEVIGRLTGELEKAAAPVMESRKAPVKAFMPAVIQDVVSDYLSKKQPAIPSGNAWFDSKTGGGYRCGRYTIVAARPKIGKSPWAFTSIAYNCQRGTWVSLFSLEQDRKEVSLNLVPYLTNLPNIVCVRPHLRTPDQQDAVLEALESIERDWPFEIYDEEMDCDQICWAIDRRSRKAEHESKEVLFVVDHFGLIAGGDRDIRKRYVEHSERLRKKIKQHKNAALLCLFQLNEVPREFADKRPQRSDIGESKKPLQDCFAAAFLHRYQDKETLRMTTKANINLELIRGGGSPGNVDCEFDTKRLEFVAEPEIDYDPQDWHQ
jgi:replicative DNA helicase